MSFSRESVTKNFRKCRHFIIFAIVFDAASRVIEHSGFNKKYMFSFSLYFLSAGRCRWKKSNAIWIPQATYSVTVWVITRGIAEGGNCLMREQQCKFIMKLCGCMPLNTKEMEYCRQNVLDEANLNVILAWQEHRKHTKKKTTQCLCGSAPC